MTNKIMTNTLSRQLPRVDTTTLAKTLIGFDALFNTMENRFVNQGQSNYPPHNVIRLDDNNYQIQVAVAGFKKDEIVVEVKDTVLSITGKKEDQAESSETEYLHRGLAFRNFERLFSLAEHIFVKDAAISDGVLTVNLEKIIPEEKKPKIITIKQS